MKNILIVILFLFSFNVYTQTYKKVSDLTELNYLAIDDTDLLMVVDTSSVSETKKLTFAGLNNKYYSADYDSVGGAVFYTDLTVSASNNSVLYSTTITATNVTINTALLSELINTPTINSSASNTDLLTAEEIVSTATAYLKSSLILVSPDASCSLCTVDNSDTLACASVACP